MKTMTLNSRDVFALGFAIGVALKSVEFAPEEHRWIGELLKSLSGKAYSVILNDEKLEKPGEDRTT